MAGKEDLMKNFGAVGQGSASAEKVEVSEEFKVEEVPAFMPHPLPRTLLGGHKQEEAEEVGLMSRFSLRPCSDLVYSGLSSCTAGHTLMEEGKEKEADLVVCGAGGLLPRAGRHMLGKQNGDGEVKDLGKQNGDGEVKDTLTAAKRKADDSQVAAAGASSDEKAEAAKIKWAEMPLEYIAWVLGQTREEGFIAEVVTDEAWKKEFFAFQEWVRDTFDKNGCVMVPEDFNGPNPGGLQDLIDEAWEKGMRELEMVDGCPPFVNREEDTAVALPSN